ncbi:hypothetical protein [Tepidibacter sp.]|nr:hypothetical protein [Tepidibacter sp.]
MIKKLNFFKNIKRLYECMLALIISFVIFNSFGDDEIGFNIF